MGSVPLFSYPRKLLVTASLRTPKPSEEAVGV